MAIDKVSGPAPAAWPRAGTGTPHRHAAVVGSGTTVGTPPAVTSSATSSIAPPDAAGAALAPPGRPPSLLDVLPGGQRGAAPAPPSAAPPPSFAASAAELPPTWRGAAPPGLARGDLLLVQVESVSPRVELGVMQRWLSGAPTGTTASGPFMAGAAMAEPLPAAMQADQLALRQISWRLPDAAALATQWRVLLLAGPEGRRADPRTATAAAVASASPTPAPPLGPAAPAAEQARTATPVPDRWLYPAYAWGGVHALLHVVDDDFDPPPARHRPRHALALRLDVTVPGIGALVVLVQQLDNDIQMHFFLADEAALPRVNAVLPALGSALSLCGLTLRRCGLSSGEPAPPRLQVAPATAVDAPARRQAIARISPGLFRAAAEVVLLLSATFSPTPPGSPADVALHGA